MFLLHFLSCIVGIWIITFSVNAVDTEGDLNCEENTEPQSQHFMLFEDEQVCCGKEKYQLGTGSEYLQYFKDCSVEPKNETMSFSDCYWTFYECVILKSLGTKELTQTSFVELMAQHLSDSKKSAIMSLATNDLENKPVTTASSGGNSQLQPIKTFWDRYFKAEYKVCTESLTLSDELKSSLQKFWDPADLCIDGKSPKFFFMPVKHADTLICVQSFVDKIPNAKINSTIPLEAYIYPACSMMLGGVITEKDLDDPKLNYDTILSTGIPKFFSKSIKTYMMTEFLNNSRIQYFPNEADSSAGVQEIAKEVMKSKEEELGDIINTDAKDRYLNIFTIYTIFAEAFSTVNSLCQGH